MFADFHRELLYRYVYSSQKSTKLFLRYFASLMTGTPFLSRNYIFYLLALLLLTVGPIKAQSSQVLEADHLCQPPNPYDRNCLAKALAIIGNSPRTLVITRQFSVDTSLTIPPNVKLKIEQGGGFMLLNSGHLVVAASLEAGLYQIFFGFISNIYFFGGPSVEQVYPQWFGATGNAKFAGFTATAGNPNIKLRGQNSFRAGDAVTLLGAGPSGSPLVTTVGSVDRMALTLSAPPSTTVTNANPIYTEDDSAALNAWTNSVRGAATLGTFYDTRSVFGPARLYLPKGFYTVCTEPVLVYSSTVLEAEQASTNTGGSLIQCNPALPALRISANNYDPDGKILNYGNGNSYFDHVSIRGGFDCGYVNAAPAVQYLNAGNLHSDNRWDHPFFERINGFAIAVGYQTTLTGHYASGATSVTLADASTFCLKRFADAIDQHCATIVIVGAGIGGTDLVTDIVEGIPSTPLPTPPGGQPATVVIDAPIRNASGVTNPIVYSLHDVVGALHIEHAELDVGRGLFTARNRATGDVTVEHAELFYAIHGAFNVDSLEPFALRFTDSTCYGCGAPQSANPEENHSIYWIDRSHAQTNDIIINNVSFDCANTTPGKSCLTAKGGVYLSGGVFISGARTINFVNNQLYNADNNSFSKSALFTKVKNLNISENTFDYDVFLTNWASSVALRIGQASAIHITNNTFNNHTESSIPKVIGFETVPSGSVIQGNLFQGLIIQTSDKVTSH